MPMGLSLKWRSAKPDIFCHLDIKPTYEASNGGLSPYFKLELLIEGVSFRLCFFQIKV